MKMQMNRFKSMVSFVLIGVLPVALYAQQPKISNFRPYDKTGINQFETLKSDTVPFTGLTIR